MVGIGESKESSWVFLFSSCCVDSGCLFDCKRFDSYPKKIMKVSFCTQRRG